MARTITPAERKAADAKYARYEASFAGQLNKIKNCESKASHTPAYDKHYNATFCTTCETELN
jgi:hypothetical protein